MTLKTLFILQLPELVSPLHIPGPHGLPDTSNLISCMLASMHTHTHHPDTNTVLPETETTLMDDIVAILAPWK